MILAVASGKGGTGKTTVAVNLALAWAETRQVSLFDLDVEEPNAALFLKPVITKTKTVSRMVPAFDLDNCIYCGLCAEKCMFNALVVLENRILVFPELCHGCRVCQYICPQNAITSGEHAIGLARSGMADNIAFFDGILNPGQTASPSLVKAVRAEGGNREISILDLPPGTSCSAVESLQGVDACLMVTEPTRFGIHDFTLLAGLADHLQIPAAVLVNRWTDDCGAFFCQNWDDRFPVIGKIELSSSLARLSSMGLPAVNADERFASVFRDLVSRLEGWKKN